MVLASYIDLWSVVLCRSGSDRQTDTHRHRKTDAAKTILVLIPT